MKVVIVDYGAGNLHSVSRAVVNAGTRPLVTSNPAYLEDAEALIVPGVGAAADTMANLRRSGFVEPIREYIASGRPFLGVCMGQQALFDVSEEGGEHECLGVLPGRVVRFPNGLKVPHMGWNQVRIAQTAPDLRGDRRRLVLLLRALVLSEAADAGSRHRRDGVRGDVPVGGRAGQRRRHAVPPGEER